MLPGVHTVFHFLLTSVPNCNQIALWITFKLNDCAKRRKMIQQNDVNQWFRKCSKK